MRGLKRKTPPVGGVCGVLVLAVFYARADGRLLGKEDPAANPRFHLDAGCLLHGDFSCSPASVPDKEQCQPKQRIPQVIFMTFAIFMAIALLNKAKLLVIQ
jgi:hypothetical protein